MQEERAGQHRKERRQTSSEDSNIQLQRATQPHNRTVAGDGDDGEPALMPREGQNDVLPPPKNTGSTTQRPHLPPDN